jgi:hypothetical protein
MITNETIEAFNARQIVNVNSIKKMKPSELDRVKMHGSNAENLLKDKNFALFVHQFKFTVCDQLSEVKEYTEEANNKRIALSSQLKGIDAFVTMLQEAAHYKNLVVTQQSPSQN